MIEPSVGNKVAQIKKYSDPKRVQLIAHKMLGNNFQVHPSSRADKKYMIMDPGGKHLHFGEMGYEDWTKHQDEARRNRFRQRNRRWKDSPKWSSAWLAYHLLW